MAVRIAVLGASGRTGRLVVAELLARGHDVVAVARNGSDPAGRVEWVVGDVRQADVLGKAVGGADAVISALGPTRGSRAPHAEVAPLLLRVMRDHGVDRYVAVSGAGLTIPGDAKSVRDRVISALLARTAMVRDKAAEYQACVDSGVRWTLVRPPRLVDTARTGAVEHHAHRSPRTTSLSRSDLAAFLVDAVEQDLYVEAAPLVAHR